MIERWMKKKMEVCFLLGEVVAHDGSTVYSFTIWYKADKVP